MSVYYIVCWSVAVWCGSVYRHSMHCTDCSTETRCSITVLLYMLYWHAFCWIKKIHYSEMLTISKCRIFEAVCTIVTTLVWMGNATSSVWSWLVGQLWNMNLMFPKRSWSIWRYCCNTCTKTGKVLELRQCYLGQASSNKDWIWGNLNWFSVNSWSYFCLQKTVCLPSSSDMPVRNVWARRCDSKPPCRQSQVRDVQFVAIPGVYILHCP